MLFHAGPRPAAELPWWAHLAQPDGRRVSLLPSLLYYRRLCRSHISPSGPSYPPAGVVEPIRLASLVPWCPLGGGVDRDRNAAVSRSRMCTKPFFRVIAALPASGGAVTEYTFGRDADGGTHVSGAPPLPRRCASSSFSRLCRFIARAVGARGTCCSALLTSPPAPSILRLSATWQVTLSGPSLLLCLTPSATCSRACWSVPAVPRSSAQLCRHCQRQSA